MLYIHFVWFGIKPPSLLTSKIFKKAQYLLGNFRHFSPDLKQSLKVIIWTSEKLLNHFIAQTHTHRLQNHIEVRTISSLFHNSTPLPETRTLYPLLEWAIIVESEGTLRNRAIATDILKIILLYEHGGLFVDSGLEYESDPLKIPEIKTKLIHEDQLKAQSKVGFGFFDDDSDEEIDYHPGESYYYNSLSAHQGLYPAFFKEYKKFQLGIVRLQTQFDIQILYASPYAINTVRPLLFPIFQAWAEYISHQKTTGSRIDNTVFNRQNRIYSPPKNREMTPVEQIIYMQSRLFTWTGHIIIREFEKVIETDEINVYLFQYVTLNAFIRGRKEKFNFFTDFPTISLKNPQTQQYDNYRVKEQGTRDDTDYEYPGRHHSISNLLARKKLKK